MSRYEPTDTLVQQYAARYGVDDCIAAAEMDLEEEVLRAHEMCTSIGTDRWECQCGDRFDGDSNACSDHRSIKKGYSVRYEPTPDGKYQVRILEKTSWLWKK